MAQPTSQVLAMYHGEPQMVKLTNGELIIAVLYREVDDIENQQAVWLDKPVRVHQIKRKPDGVALFMERWLPVSIEHMFQIAQADVLTVGGLSDEVIADYLQVSGQQYGSVGPSIPTPENEEEQRSQVSNELWLRQFEHMPTRDVKH